MFHIVLLEPEIPPNTGNIMRLAFNMGATLHLIKPFAFDLSDKQLRRAGLDYYQAIRLCQYDSFPQFEKQFSPQRLFALTTKCQNKYSDVCFQKGDAFLFGAETRGLPEYIRNKYPTLTIPMVDNSRSLNLANSVAIVLYEAWRQLNFI